MHADKGAWKTNQRMEIHLILTGMVLVATETVLLPYGYGFFFPWPFLFFRLCNYDIHSVHQHLSLTDPEVSFSNHHSFYMVRGLGKVLPELKEGL